MNNEKIIASCGNDCSICPRHLPKTDDELHKAAVLWQKIGYRDRVVSDDEISCTGCKKDNMCRYKIKECSEKKHIEGCFECELYPCEKITECFTATMKFEPACKKVCTPDEYEIISKAFFEKRKNIEEARSAEV